MMTLIGNGGCARPWATLGVAAELTASHTDLLEMLLSSIRFSCRMGSS